MILAPSPQTLLHKKDPNYVMTLMCDCSIPDSLRNVDIDQNSSQGATQPFIDLFFLTSCGENPKVRHSSYYSAFILQHALKTNNPLVSLSFAFLALQINDISEALHFLKESAKNGNIDSLNLIGWIFYHYRNHLTFSSIEDANKCSLLWFFRGKKSGSRNSNYFLGDYYSNIHYKTNFNQFLLSSHYYSILVNDKDYHTADLTHKLIKNLSMLLIESLKTQNSNKIIEKSLKQLIYSIANTGDPMIPLYIKTFYQNDQEIMKFWEKVTSPFDNRMSSKHKKQDIFKIDDEYVYSERLAASMKDNTTIHLTRWLNQLLGSVDPFKSFITSSFILQRYPPDSNGPKVSSVDIYKRKEKEKNETEFHKLITKEEKVETLADYNGYNEPISAYFPSKNKTSMLLQAFELSSPKFIKRNLMLVSIILNNIYGENQHGLIDSRLWQNKIKSKKKSDQIKCGFICWLMNDRTSAFILFQKASIQGSTLASLMCALLLFYQIRRQPKNKYQSEPLSENDVFLKNQAVPFFLHCTDDPIALIHLHMITKDITFYERAVALLGLSGNLLNNTELTKQQFGNLNKVNEKSFVFSTPFELIGDLFFNGIKYVKDMEIARALYAYAIDADSKDSIINPELYAKFEASK